MSKMSTLGPGTFGVFAFIIIQETPVTEDLSLLQPKERINLSWILRYLLLL